MSEKETNPKEEKKVTLQESQESVELEDEFFSAQELLDESESIKKSVKFEPSESLLEEIIEVEREEEGTGNESEKSRPMRLDFLPRTTFFLDDQELVPKAETEMFTLESPKSAYQISAEELPSVKSKVSSMEAFQFVKRYSTTKFGDTGNALVTDAFVSLLSL